jgi:hypothetical protein
MPLDPVAVMDMRDELRGTEAFRIRHDISRLIRSWRSFAGNREELVALLGEATELPQALQLWSQDNREEFEEFLEEVRRLLHNYVASAMTLVSHSRDTVERRLPPDPGDKLAEHYQILVDALFTESPLAQFVQSLRNVMLHVRLPVAYGVSRWSRDEGLRQTVVLDRDNLLARGKWSSLAKQYLEEAGETIDLLEVIQGYSHIVHQLQSWLRQALMQRHREPLKELEERHAELRKLWLEATGESVQVD